MERIKLDRQGMFKGMTFAGRSVDQIWYQIWSSEFSGEWGKIMGEAEFVGKLVEAELKGMKDETTKN